MKRKKKNMRAMGRFRYVLLGCSSGRTNIPRHRRATQLEQRIFRLANIFYFDWDILNDRVVYSATWPVVFKQKSFVSGIQRKLTMEGQSSEGGLLEVFSDILQGQCLMQREYELSWLDDKSFWYRVDAEIAYDKMGSPCRALAVFTDITELREKQHALFARTQRDALTSLYNKVATEELIKACILERSKEKHALFFIDIDNFKLINDSLGHLRGDDLLQWLSGELQSMFGTEDILGRIGGDEFMAFYVDLQDWGEAAQRAREIIQRMLSIKVDPDGLYRLSVSIGIAIYEQGGKNFLRLYEEADRALYEAKKCGKNQYVFHSGFEEETILKRADGR